MSNVSLFNVHTVQHMYNSSLVFIVISIIVWYCSSFVHFGYCLKFCLFGCYKHLCVFVDGISLFLLYFSFITTFFQLWNLVESFITLSFVTGALKNLGCRKFHTLVLLNVYYETYLQVLLQFFFFYKNVDSC